MFQEYHKYFFGPNDPPEKIGCREKINTRRSRTAILLGKTKKNRKLHIAFTIRKTKIRVISARDMSQKDRQDYEEEP
jgi:uncharacterized DUF497 family protein